METVRAVFAGFAAGYVMGLALVAVSALYLLQLREHPWVKRAFPPETNSFLLLVPLSVVLFLAWTAIGMLLGALFRLLEAQVPEDGLGSPNQAYTGIILLVTAALVVSLVRLFPRAAVPILLGAAAFVGIFGYAMPWLAV